MSYEIPYICPKCDHDRWIVADPDDDASKAVKCPSCGFEDEVRLSSNVVEADSLDEVADVVAKELDK